MAPIEAYESIYRAGPEIQEAALVVASEALRDLKTWENLLGSKKDAEAMVVQLAQLGIETREEFALPNNDPPF